MSSPLFSSPFSSPDDPLSQIPPPLTLPHSPSAKRTRSHSTKASHTKCSPLLHNEKVLRSPKLPNEMSMGRRNSSGDLEGSGSFGKKSPRRRTRAASPQLSRNGIVKFKKVKDSIIFRSGDDESSGSEIVLSGAHSDDFFQFQARSDSAGSLDGRESAEHRAKRERGNAVVDPPFPFGKRPRHRKIIPVFREGCEEADLSIPSPTSEESTSPFCTNSQSKSSPIHPSTPPFSFPFPSISRHSLSPSISRRSPPPPSSPPPSSPPPPTSPSSPPPPTSPSSRVTSHSPQFTTKTPPLAGHNISMSPTSPSQKGRSRTPSQTRTHTDGSSLIRPRSPILLKSWRKGADKGGDKEKDKEKDKDKEKEKGNDKESDFSKDESPSVPLGLPSRRSRKGERECCGGELQLQLQRPHSPLKERNETHWRRDRVIGIPGVSKTSPKQQPLHSPRHLPPLNLGVLKSNKRTNEIIYDPADAPGELPKGGQTTNKTEGNTPRMNMSTLKTKESLDQQTNLSGRPPKSPFGLRSPRSLFGKRVPNSPRKIAPDRTNHKQLTLFLHLQDNLLAQTLLRRMNACAPQQIDLETTSVHDMAMYLLLWIHGDPESLFYQSLVREVNHVRNLAAVMRERSMAVVTLQYMWRMIDISDILYPIRKLTASLSKKNINLLTDPPEQGENPFADHAKWQRLKRKFHQAINPLIDASALPPFLCLLAWKSYQSIESIEDQGEKKQMPLKNWVVGAVYLLRFVVPKLANSGSGGRLLGRFLMRMCTKSSFPCSDCLMNELLKETHESFDTFCWEVKERGRKLEPGGFLDYYQVDGHEFCNHMIRQRLVENVSLFIADSGIMRNPKGAEGGEEVEREEEEREGRGEKEEDQREEEVDDRTRKTSWKGDEFLEEGEQEETDVEIEARTMAKLFLAELKSIDGLKLRRSDLEFPDG